MRPEKLEQLLGKARPRPWVKHPADAPHVLMQGQDVDLACAAVNVLPHLIELWKAAAAEHAGLEKTDHARDCTICPALAKLESLEASR